MASGHRAETTDHELKWQQNQPPNCRPSELPTTKQAMRSRHRADPAHQPKERHIRPPGKQAKQATTRRAPPPIGRDGGTSNHQASMASGYQAGTTDNRLKWQQIQPTKNKPSKLPATKQATQSRHCAGTSAHKPIRQQTQPLASNAKQADHQVGTTAHQPKGRLILAPGGKHGKPPADLAAHPGGLIELRRWWSFCVWTR